MTFSSSFVPAEINGVLMQALHCYTPADGGHWRRLAQQASALAAAGLQQVYADAVFNHLIGADAEEAFNATPYDPQNRFQPIGGQGPIRSWTHDSYPVRAGASSAMQWHWWHFDAVDDNSHERGFKAVWRIEAKAFFTPAASAGPDAAPPPIPAAWRCC
ncbi:hypothetical protein KBY97_03800 [Synechococcus sp. ATX 2A4]|uniref:hypothetical protein n=1 Tax=Synechococcus sp. ATX 2A4 TaxID=2823727 RepID=UPI0020CD5EEB|nr:hypothetical protein [Synechococcus sp. ATX 2A4]MCP9884254.1 hypothetical protein [Synechococcus sp. ATX 2A4]